MKIRQILQTAVDSLGVVHTIANVVRFDGQKMFSAWLMSCAGDTVVWKSSGQSIRWDVSEYAEKAGLMLVINKPSVKPMLLGCPVQRPLLNRSI